MQSSIESQVRNTEPFGQGGIRRYIFPALTVASLTAMVLSVGMWARSHYIVDNARKEHNRTQWYVSSIYGRILIAWGSRSPFPSDDEWTYGTEPMPENIVDRWQPTIWKMIGVDWRHEPLNAEFGTRGGWVRIRWPLVAAVMAILPGVRLIAERRRRKAIERLKHGQCPQCGQDLRGSTGRCTNCGALIGVTDA